MFGHVGMDVHIRVSFQFISSFTSVAVTNTQSRKITFGEKEFIGLIIPGHSSLVMAVKAGTKAGIFRQA